MRPNPSTHTAGEHEEGRDDDEQAGEWTDREVDPAEQQGERLSERDEAERRAREHDGRDVEVREVAAVLRQDVGPERDDHRREDDDRGVVAFDESRDLRPAALRSCRLLGGVRGRADRSVDDPRLGHIVALERRDSLATGHHDHAVAQPLELQGVARGEDDGHSPGGYLAQDAIDLGARADVDALCRLVGDENRRLGEHRARHHDLLLISARERRDGRLERRRSHGQLRELAFDQLDLALAAHEGAGLELVERGQRSVLAHVQVDHQTLGQSVGRHIGRALEQFPPGKLPAGDVDRAGRRFSPGKGTEESRLTVADHTRHTHDLPLPGRERDVVEAVSAQPFHLQQRRLVAGGRVFRREGGFESPPDDHGEEVGVGDLPDGGCPAEPAVAEDGDPIGDPSNLGQTVRDVDDGRPAFGELADGGEEELDGVLRERRGGLVENQEPWRYGERLGELEQVAAGDAEG
jgi:hypothetical protein